MNVKTNSEVLGVASWQEMRACLLIFLLSPSVCGEGLGRELEGIFGTRQRCGGPVFGNIRALSSVWGRTGLKSRAVFTRCCAGAGYIFVNRSGSVKEEGSLCSKPAQKRYALLLSPELCFESTIRCTP